MAQLRGALVSICHGGGPLPALKDPAHAALIRNLREEVPKLLKLGTDEAPAAILILSAHFQTSTPTFSSGKTHKLLYDYGGFPSEAYKLQYHADGAPDIAQRAIALLQQHGIRAKADTERGWDHGVFVPMLLISPEGRVPIVQASILASQNAEDLINLGRALGQLRNENVTILGSGSPSYHNLRDWLSGRVLYDDKFPQRQAEWNRAVEKALEEKDDAKRIKALIGWRSFPHSYEMHPNGAAEHFSTMLVCAGAADSANVHCSMFDVMGAQQHTIWWD